ncbi:caspase family protein [Labrys portucalensis]|uniref:Caspase family protein n=1 Tax=Labrys neptuniae TaxID=376174 RepID=A0ABV6ZBD1_9HYPH
MRMRIVHIRAVLSVAIFVGLWGSAGVAHADKRVALLIGNARYQNAVMLTNPPNDVSGMKAALSQAGFTIIQPENDLTRQGMVQALRAFETQATTADVAVIYYSGHGMELNGVNYLLPVDARLATDRDVEDEAVTLDRVLRSIEGASRLKLVILDACRNNPFLPRMSRSNANRAVSRGLARVEPAGTNTLIAYSAAAGTVAADGDGLNSPFTASLIKRIVEPGIDVRIMLGNVRDDVMSDTGNQQQPFVNGSLGGGVLSLMEAPASAGASPATDPLFGEAAQVWPALRGSTDVGELETFRKRYANTFFGELADKRIKELSVPATTKTAPPVVPQTASDPAAGQKQAAAVTPVRPAAPPPETECDRLAAGPLDPDRVGAGVLFGQIDAARAVAACNDALHQYPGTRRLLFQYGRALDAAKRHAEAFATYQQAFAAGSLAAAHNLAFLYREGSGVPRDYAEALRWFRKAADGGYANSYVSIGYLYELGLGVSRNYTEAMRWYRQGADRGDVESHANIALLYEGGKGVKRDYAEALRWYQKAADLGDTNSLASLASYYNNGRGTAKNPMEAADYAFKALERGSEFELNELMTNAKAWSPRFHSEMLLKLKARGYYDGPITSSFNEQARAALRKLAGR